MSGPEDETEEDAPIVPRERTRSQMMMGALATELEVQEAENRAEVLSAALRKIRHLTALLGSVSVALGIDQPKNPLEVIDALKKRLRDGKDPNT